MAVKAILTKSSGSNTVSIPASPAYPGGTCAYPYDLYDITYTDDDRCHVSGRSAQLAASVSCKPDDTSIFDLYPSSLGNLARQWVISAATITFPLGTEDLFRSSYGLQQPGYIPNAYGLTGGGNFCCQHMDISALSMTTFEWGDIFSLINFSFIGSTEYRCGFIHEFDDHAGSGGTLGCVPIAMEIDASSDIPTWYATTPTHIGVNDKDVAYALTQADCDNDGTWFHIPCDMGSQNANRYIDDKKCIGMGRYFGVWNTSAGWQSEDGAAFYFRNGLVGNNYNEDVPGPMPANGYSGVFYAYDTGNTDGYGFNIYDTEWTMRATVSAHQGLPASIDIFGQWYLPSPATTWTIYATCYPSATVIPVASGAIPTVFPFGVKTTATPDWSAVPAGTVCVVLALGSDGTYTQGDGHTIRQILSVQQMPGDNMPQTAVWPVVFPAFCRKCIP